MFKDWKILKKDYPEHANEYSTVAQWCNDSGEYTIIDDDEYYRVVHIVPSPEEESEAEYDSD